MKHDGEKVNIQCLTPKTVGEHRAYLFEMVKLKLWFVWHWLRKHPDEECSFVLRERVDIYRKTDINDETMNPVTLHFDDPRWLELEWSLTRLYDEWHDDVSVERFEREGFEICRPQIEARVVRDFEERPYVLDYQCGCLKYDPPYKQWPHRVWFHIANPLMPCSIFDDPGYVPGCLRDLMTRSAAEFDVYELGTNTWLNSYSRWSEYFPDEWRNNLGPEIKDVKWHFGFWGQFLTARGTFNERNGRQLRETGEFPFWPRQAWCTFEALRKHLGKMNNAKAQRRRGRGE